jgi:epoxide hydrolase
VDVPTGYIDFPKEPLRAPREVLSRAYTNLRRWTVAKKGGHFPAMECPDVLARDAREFFSPLG